MSKENELEIEKLTEGLNDHNRKVYEVVLKAHLAKKEFQKHPALRRPFAEKLAQLIKEAQDRGDTIEVNRFAIDAPSRKPVEIAVKQSSREKEK